MMEKRTVLQICGLGAISGLRTMSGLALLARALQQRPPQHWPHAVVRRMATEPAPTLLQLMAAGELVADKLPFLSARTAPPALAGRATSGAVVGATVSMLHDRSPLLGAALGGSAALVAAFAGYHARRLLTGEERLPDFLVALLEDGLVWGLGKRLAG